MKKKRFSKIMAALGLGTCMATNVNGCVYGPPPVDDTASKTILPSEKNSEVITDSSNFSPEENIPIDVYGPPSYFGNSDEEEQ